MTTWFTENSTMPMVTGVILVVILLALGFSAREKVMMFLAMAVAMLTVATVATERMIVTDNEEVMQAVYDLADAVEANDQARVLTFVSKSRADTVARVRAEMPRYDFDSCHVVGTNYIEASPGEVPKVIEISFIVSVRVRVDNGPEPLWGQRKVILQFEQQPDGSWQVIDYSHEDPRRGVTV